MIACHGTTTVPDGEAEDETKSSMQTEYASERSGTQRTAITFNTLVMRKPNLHIGIKRRP